MRKRDELASPQSCLNKAADDEMVFVLRAKDPLAPHTVRVWAAAYEEAGGRPEKVAEAHECANAMELWRKEHSHEPPLPR